MDTASSRSTRAFSFDAAAVVALTATVALAGLIAIPSSNLPFLATKVSLLAVGGIFALALYILARLVRQNIILPPVTLLGALWLVPVAYLLSALFSGAGIERAFFGNELEVDTAGFLVLVSLVATLAALVLRRRSDFVLSYRILGTGFFLAIAAQIAFVAIAQWSPTTVAATTTLVGSFVDLGMFAGLGASIMLLALRFVTVSARMRIAVWAGLAVSLFLVAVANASTVWVLTGLIALGLFIEAVMRRRPSGDESDLEGVEVMAAMPEDRASASPSSLAAPLAVLAIALFFLIGGSTIGASLASSLSANSLDVRPSWQATFDIGSHTYASAPLFGTGPNTFGESWLMHRDRSLNETPFWTVDFMSGIGYIPTSFVTVGAIGALAWIVFLASFLVVGTRFLLFRAPQDPFIRFVSLSSFIGALYLFALMAVASPGPFLIALGFLLAGTFASTIRHGAGSMEWGVAFARSPRIGFVIVFVLTLVLLGSVLAMYTVVERYLAMASYVGAANALSAGNLDEADRRASQSILFSPTDEAYRLDAAVGVARLRAIAADDTLTEQQARESFQSVLQETIASGLTATQLNERDYRNWVQLGNVYGNVASLGIEGAYDNAKTAYARARELNPTNPSLPFILAQLEIAGKKPAEAEALLTEAITLKRNYTEAIFLLSQLEVQLGKAREALEAAEAAAYLAPREPGVLFQVGILRLGTGATDGGIAALKEAVAIDPNYANAHFFLAVAYATKKDFASAITELEAVAAISPENRTAVAGYLDSLRTNKNPFPPTLSVTPVPEPTPAP